MDNNSFNRVVGGIQCVIRVTRVRRRTDIVVISSINASIFLISTDAGNNQWPATQPSLRYCARWVQD